MHPVYRFVARHSLFLAPGVGFVGAAWVLGRMAAPWPAWVTLILAILVVWTVPIWRRQKATALRSAEDFQKRLRASRISFLHFYSDF